MVVEVKRIARERPSDAGLRLAEAAELSPNPARLRVLARLNDFCQAGRYPEAPGPTLTADQVREQMVDAREVFQWLMSE